jgi:hypothetical protein
MQRKLGDFKALPAAPCSRGKFVHKKKLNLSTGNYGLRICFHDLCVSERKIFRKIWQSEHKTNKHRTSVRAGYPPQCDPQTCPAMPSEATRPAALAMLERILRRLGGLE